MKQAGMVVGLVAILGFAGCGDDASEGVATKGDAGAPAGGEMPAAGGAAQGGAAQGGATGDAVGGMAGSDGGRWAGGDGGATGVPALAPDGDEDGDGLTNAEERELKLDPEAWDSDDDGWSDPDEVGSVDDPTDSDADGIIDALESDFTDNDRDGISDTTDIAGGWQVAAGRFYPHVIANDGSSATRVEVVVSGEDVTQVALHTPPGFYDKTVLPNELAVDGQAIGSEPLDLFDDGTHGDRFAGDGIWSRGGITTTMSSRSQTGVRDWVLFVELLVTAGGVDEERYLGIPAPNAAQGERVVQPGSMGFYLGVIDSAALVQPQRLSDELQKTPHLLNIVDPARATSLKRDFTDPTPTSAFDVETADPFRRVLDEIPGDVDFVAVLPETDARGTRIAGEYRQARVDASGTGLPIYVPWPAWGSESETFKGGVLLDWALSFPLNHELMHQWGAFLSPALGAGIAETHWGVASTYGVLGGFDPKTFVENQNGTFSMGFFSGAGNEWSTTTFSPIELYLAGLAPASEVAPIISIIGAKPVGYTDTSVIVSGTKKTTTINQIVTQHGARIPAYADAQKAFSMAFAIYSERPLTSTEMSWLDTFADFYGRASLPGAISFPEATLGRATMTTALPKLVSE